MQDNQLKLVNKLKKFLDEWEKSTSFVFDPDEKLYITNALFYKARHE